MLWKRVWHAYCNVIQIQCNRQLWFYFKTWLKISNAISQLSRIAKEITGAVTKGSNAHSSEGTVMIFLWVWITLIAFKKKGFKNRDCLNAIPKKSRSHPLLGLQFTFYNSPQAEDIKTIPSVSWIGALTFELWMEDKSVGAITGFPLIFTEWAWLFLEVKWCYKGWTPGATHLYLKQHRM